jgi:hypothetical protein
MTSSLTNYIRTIVESFVFFRNGRETCRPIPWHFLPGPGPGEKIR